MLQADCRGEFSEAGDCHIGSTVGRSDGTDTWARGGAVYPDCRQAESLSWNDVVIDALTYMQDTVSRYVDAAEGQTKKIERGFVSPRLLRGDDFIEGDFKLRSGARE